MHSSDIDKKNVPGKKMEQLYGGYMGDIEKIKPFVLTLENKFIKSYLKSKVGKNIKVLEVGSNTGIVSKYFCDYLSSKGFSIELVVSDRNPEGLGSIFNSTINNYSVIKKVVENKNLPFKDSMFDFVIGRAFSHYERDYDDEIKVFKEVRRVLLFGGFFINQSVNFPTEKESELWRKIQKVVSREANVHTLKYTKKQLVSIFNNSVFLFKQIIDPVIHTKEDTLKRFGLTSSSKKIQKIKELIKEVPEYKRKSFWVDENNFSWIISSNIFICKKDK